MRRIGECIKWIIFELDEVMVIVGIMVIFILFAIGAIALEVIHRFVRP